MPVEATPGPKAGLRLPTPPSVNRGHGLDGLACLSARELSTRESKRAWYTEEKMNIEIRIPSPNDPATNTPHQVGGSLNRPSMANVGRDEFIRELATEPGVHAQVIRNMVRAFLAAALRGGHARTPDGWRSVIQDMRYVLGSALSEGIEQVRPVSPSKRPYLPVRAKPAAPPRPLVAHDPLIPIIPSPEDDEADLASYQLQPVHLVHALVGAYVTARMRTDDGATPEGRSRILGEARELVWDGILDAVKQVPCPPALRPLKPARPKRPSPPEWER